MGEAGVHQAVEAIDVEHRDRHQRQVVGAEVVDGCRLREVGDQVAMGQHHALGQARGSRRVRQRGRAVEKSSRCWSSGSPNISSNDASPMTATGRPPAAARAASAASAADDQEVGAGVVELVGDLVGA